MVIMAWHDFIPAFNKYQWGALVEENEREQVEIPVQSQKTSAQSLFLGFEHAGRNFYLEIFFDGKDHPGKAVLNVVDDVTDYIDHRFVPKTDRFIQDTETFTRGVGVGDTGLNDLVNSEIIRGNPRGGLESALNLSKIKKTQSFKNFESAYPDEAMRILNNDLRKKDYDLVSDYFKNNPIYGGKKVTDPTAGISIRKRTVLDDMQGTYPTYDDYLSKKTGYNHTSDFYETGDPRAFFFDDGANPGFTGTYPTKYFVKVNNPQKYEPLIPQGHAHYSTKDPISFYDPNVELYKNMETFSGNIFGKKIKKPIKK